MKIKNNICLIRGILYVQEIARCKSISRAAEENNIKASNLSVIINDLEKQIGTKLFKRSTLGCKPTEMGKKIAACAFEITELLKNITNIQEKSYIEKNILNIYISTNMEIDNQEFIQQHPDIILNIIDEDIWADIKICNHPPSNKYDKYTELQIGKGVKQKIWISCDEHNQSAMLFFDFIVAKLLHEYDQ